MKRSFLFLATSAICSGFSTAHAAPILNISSEGLAAASAAEALFQSKLKSGYLTEYFDTGYSVGAQALSISSSVGVGTFSVDALDAGTGGECDDAPFSCDAGIAVLDSSTSPFSGRFDVSADNWLDSMDFQKMTISPTEGYTSLGFFMTDPNDVGGRFSIGGVDFLFEDIFGQSLGSGQIFYLSFFDSEGLGDLSIHANARNDGYGIDNVTVGTVPEPGTLALIGLGLFGIGMTRFKKSR